MGQNNNISIFKCFLSLSFILANIATILELAEIIGNTTQPRVRLKR